MSASSIAKTSWTSEEYLAWERLQSDKHEFHDGEVFDMAGATFDHDKIVINIGAELRAALRQKPCDVCASDLRVKVSATGLYTYPDVSVVCGRPVFEDDVLDTLLNPILLVEVLSGSTEDYDRGTKFKNYRTIPSFQEYLLVATDKVLVETYTRREDGSWVLREHRSGERVKLVSVGVELSVDELYLKVFEGSGGLVQG